MKKALITGAAGFLGYHLSAYLSEKQYSLTLCDNFLRGERDAEFEILCKKDNVNFLELDLTKESNFKKLGGSYDEVYHMAAINGTRFFYEIPDKVLRVNLLSTIFLLDWFVASDSEKIIYPSSSEVYAGTISLNSKPIPTPENVTLSIPDVFNPRFSYAGSKIAGELLVINYSRIHKFPMNIVRYHNIYGPRMGNEHVISQFIRRAVDKEDPFEIYGADYKRAFCYVTDACEETYRLVSGNKLVNEVAHIGNPKCETDALDLAKMICKIAGWNPEFDIRPAPEGSVKRRVPDTGKIEKALNFAPQVDLQRGLKKTYKWYLKRK